MISFGSEASRRMWRDRLELRVLPVVAPTGNPLDSVSGDIIEALEDVDLVHVHQAFTRSSQVSILAAKFLGLPVCVSDHGGRTNHLDRVAPYMDMVDLFLSYSRCGQARISTARPSVLVPGGVDTDEFTPGQVPAAREYILFVGRLLRHKGIDRLISAVPVDMPLVICGRPTDPDYFGYLRAISRVRNTRFVLDADDDDTRDLYRRAWATVLPSVHLDAWGNVYPFPELMGLAMLESMACGTPAIVSTAGALPEFVLEGETGFIFSSLRELRSRCTQLATTAGLADEMGARAREVCQREYSLEPVGAAVWDAYMKVADS